MTRPLRQARRAVCHTAAARRSCALVSGHLQAGCLARYSHNPPGRAGFRVRHGLPPRRDAAWGLSTHAGHCRVRPLQNISRRSCRTGASGVIVQPQAGGRLRRFRRMPRRWPWHLIGPGICHSALSGYHVARAELLRWPPGVALRWTVRSGIAARAACAPGFASCRRSDWSEHRARRDGSAPRRPTAPPVPLYRRPAPPSARCWRPAPCSAYAVDSAAPAGAGRQLPAVSGDGAARPVRRYRFGVPVPAAGAARVGSIFTQLHWLCLLRLASDRALRCWHVVLLTLRTLYWPGHCMNSWR